MIRILLPEPYLVRKTFAPAVAPRRSALLAMALDAVARNDPLYALTDALVVSGIDSAACATAVLVALLVAPGASAAACASISTSARTRAPERPGGAPRIVVARAELESDLEREAQLRKEAAAARDLVVVVTFRLSQRFIKLSSPGLFFAPPSPTVEIRLVLTGPLGLNRRVSRGAGS